MKKAELLKCCGSTKWATAMLKAQPFDSLDAMLRKSDEVFASLKKTDLLEAFAANTRVLDSELYERRFGFSFVIDTADKSIEDIVGAMNARMSNGPHAELAIAAEEQRKITRDRLASAFRESS
ncbi:MAG TPA: 2-oxo-4-hydroxy-4-carboxy-5-ureidoimidazoline decarboxylase [Vicinamibacterales bacterium]|nr:2-oxo-4-hydroxy-4-carboxy-5-ureidoimidazoline decarboxylase [Vicinamibacterales bacterium]